MGPPHQKENRKQKIIQFNLEKNNGNTQNEWINDKNNIDSDVESIESYLYDVKPFKPGDKPGDLLGWLIDPFKWLLGDLQRSRNESPGTGNFVGEFRLRFL